MSDVLRCRCVSRVMGEFDAALERLENGSYGVSEETGEPIPYARLLVLPWARTTLEM